MVDDQVHYPFAKTTQKHGFSTWNSFLQPNPMHGCSVLSMFDPLMPQWFTVPCAAQGTTEFATPVDSWICKRYDTRDGPTATLANSYNDIRKYIQCPPSWISFNEVCIRLASINRHNMLANGANIANQTCHLMNNSVLFKKPKNDKVIQHFISKIAFIFNTRVN